MMEKKKFTVIDLLIILIVFAVLAVGVLYFINQKTENKVKAEFVVLVSAMDEGFADTITVGDSISISYTEKDGGVISSVETKPAETLTFNSMDGSYAVNYIKDKEDVYVGITADVVESDLVIKAGDTPVKVGAEMPIRGKGYVGKGYVVELDIAQN